jgi:hypothetical protein
MVDSFLAIPSLLPPPQGKTSWLLEWLLEEWEVVSEEWETCCHQRGKPFLIDCDVESRVTGGVRVIVYPGSISRSTEFASRIFRRHWY